MNEIQTIPKKCTACHICEMACSYHHTRTFSRRLSSIEISKSEAVGQVEMTIHGVKDQSHRMCDFCENEDIPLCVKWCPVGAIVERRA